MTNNREKYKAMIEEVKVTGEIVDGLYGVLSDKEMEGYTNKAVIDIVNDAIDRINGIYINANNGGK